MPEWQLVACDLDGTLLDDEGFIPEENKKMLQKISQQGAIIALASGRMTDCVIPFAEQLGIDCAIIAYNGALIRARAKEKRKIIFHNPVPAIYGDFLIDYCQKNQFHLNYYLNDCLYAREDEKLRKYALIYARQTGAVFHFVPDLKVFQGQQPTKLVLITDVFNEKQPLRTRDYQYSFFQHLMGDRINLFRTNPEYLEFLNKDVDKGVGLLKLASFYGIRQSAIVAFGDGENDADMLLAAGTGVAMANAKEKVKKLANIVLDWTNTEAGIARFFKNQMKNSDTGE